VALCAQAQVLWLAAEALHSDALFPFMPVPQKTSNQCLGCLWCCNARDAVCALCIGRIIYRGAVPTSTKRREQDGGPSFLQSTLVKLCRCAARPVRARERVEPPPAGPGVPGAGVRRPALQHPPLLTCSCLLPAPAERVATRLPKRRTLCRPAASQPARPMSRARGLPQRPPRGRRAASYLGLTVGAESVWVHNPLGIFCFCAAWTHLGSAVTHVWPDSFTLARRPPRAREAPGLCKLSHLTRALPSLCNKAARAGGSEAGGAPPSLIAVDLGAALLLVQRWVPVPLSFCWQAQVGRLHAFPPLHPGDFSGWGLLVPTGKRLILRAWPRALPLEPLGGVGQQKRAACSWPVT